MAFRWRANDGPTLNAGLVAAIFQGIRTCTARKPFIFVIFQGGGGGGGGVGPPVQIDKKGMRNSMYVMYVRDGHLNRTYDDTICPPI